MILYGKTIDKEISLKHLHTTYADHRRLGVFHRSGTICVVCGAGKEGVRLIANHTVSKKGKICSTHIDVFTKKWILMTIDHIIPTALGGPDTFENKQPMCVRCNNKKADKLISIEDMKKRLQLI